MGSSRTILGFDYGHTRIGVAVGQELIATTTPLVSLPCPNRQPDWLAIQQLIIQWQPQLLVVGIPYRADGSLGSTGEDALVFRDNLYHRYRLPVEIIDERLSSREAADRINQNFARDGRRRSRKPVLDHMAAAIILESWFHHQEQNRAGS